MAQEVKIVTTRINKLSTAMRAALQLSNTCMDLGDVEGALVAEKQLVVAYKEWHALQEKRRG